VTPTLRATNATKIGPQCTALHYIAFIVKYAEARQLLNTHTLKFTVKINYGKDAKNK